MRKGIGKGGKGKDMGVFGVRAFLGRCGLLGYGGPMPRG